MTHPDRSEIARVLDLVVREARGYLDGLDGRRVRSPGAEEAVRAFDGSLPETGCGAEAALVELLREGLEGTVATGGPRSFHFVIGGSTPAALGADLLATVLDQIAYTAVTSPLAVELERLGLAWLRELFGLPAAWGGVMTTGATMANFVGLAAARQWWGQRHGVDVSEQGLAGLPPMPVLSSGYLHASTVKTLSMLGVGRSSARRFRRDAAGRVDLEAMERALEQLGGAPAVIVGNAGEVNAGDFDPIAELAELARRHGAWLHVDGAFGLFARVAPATAHLLDGLEGAHSVTVDGHKWLNVPYDCGFALVSDTSLLARAFAYEAAYLPGPEDPRPNFSAIGPESSRRARSLAVWATLRAYGRAGCRAMVERHLALAQRLARRVDEAPDLARLAPVPLNIVCFRYDPGGLDEPALDALNRELGQALLADGRVYAGSTLYEGRVALRPALVNWRTREEDVDLFVEVVRELGAGLVAARA